ncbi:MAG: PH domain-containing protein [Nocardioidaceae bacterium]
MLRWLWSLIPDQEIGSHLLVDEGERVIDEVAHHWIVYVRPVLECLLALVVFVFFLFGPVSVGWLLILVMVALLLHAGWYALSQHMDRFVITNMRVFRARGVFSRSIATMPIQRILDITVRKPMLGRIFGYGNFVFESAAQEQGLRDIRHVGDPDRRDLTIQRVVQQSGLRSARPLR